MKLRLIVALSAAVPLLMATGVSPASAGAGPQKIAVPAYFPPGGYWTQLGRLAGNAVAVANPNSGPGSSFDQSYADAISAAHNAGVKVLGYVDTGYFGFPPNNRRTRSGETSAAAWTSQAEGDVDAWYGYYGGSGLDGIFFDDALADCGSGNAHVSLYITLRDHVKQHADATVVDNPGGSVEQCYTSAADTLVTFEGTYASYVNWSPPAWESSASPGRLWHLVYDTPDENSMTNAIALSKARNAGYVYVTPDNGSNPWDTLPTGSYWTSEVSQAGAGS